VLSLTGPGRKRLDLATPAWSRVQAELVQMIGAKRWMSLIADLRTIRLAASACSTRNPG
jgi:hypothetical protein